MARYFYGGSGADVIARPISPTDDDLELALGVSYSVYTSRTGGSVITDLLTPAGGVISSVTPDEFGVRFQGPDGMIQTLWLQNQDAPTEPRWAVITPEWGAILEAVRTGVTPPIVRQATAIDQVPFAAKGMAGQTADILEARLSDDSVAFGVTPDAEIEVGGAGVDAINGVVRITTDDPTRVGYVVRGAVDQASKYFRALDNALVEKFAVKADGTISGLNLGGPFDIVGSVVLDAVEAVPTDLPVGTVILRRPA